MNDMPCDYKNEKSRQNSIFYQVFDELGDILEL